ncbi:two-component system, chemotaxis family, response regulator CheY [Lachnospiraceae bacterium RM5]|nr:two-component system, chemotaxis family, response regulator CheY [Lachnospiraceae bacterium RM5]
MVFILNKKVLICDDAMFMRMLMRTILSDLGITEIIEAENGKEAVDLYYENNPDMVFMDIAMPVFDGIEALKRIIDYDRDAKVVMCSAIGQQSVVYKAIESGAKDFIVKPFKKDDVLNALKSWA